MRAKPSVKGRPIQGHEPDWEPLRNVAPELVDDFEWMFEIELANGVRVHLYEHKWTRYCVRLDLKGRAYYPIWPRKDEEVDRYRQIDLVEVLERVLCPWWKELEATPEQILPCVTALVRLRQRG
jgi:hypothetical protein